MYASSVAEWRYGVRCAPCGVWAVRACGARERARARERDRRAAERAEAGDSGAERGEGSRERQGQRDSIADGTALRNIVGEEVAATFGDTEDLFPEGSLFVSLRAIGYLLTHAECLLSVRQKKEILRSKDKAVRFTELLSRT